LTNSGDEEFAIICLKKIYENEALPGSKEGIAKLIGGFGDKEYAMLCFKELYEEETSKLLKKELISLIIELENKNASHIKNLLETEPDTSLKSEIAYSIGKLGDKELAISSLKDLFENETDRNARINIAHSIGKLGDEEFAVTCLKEFFEVETDIEIKNNIAELICTFGDREYVIPYFLKSIENVFNSKVTLDNLVSLLEKMDNVGLLFSEDNMAHWGLKKIPQRYSF